MMKREGCEENYVKHPGLREQPAQRPWHRKEASVCEDLEEAHVAGAE